MIEAANDQGQVENIHVRNWDQAFQQWQNQGCPFDDDEFPRPGNHPIATHPWNQGIEGMKKYLTLLELNPNLLDKDRPNEELEAY